MPIDMSAAKAPPAKRTSSRGTPAAKTPAIGIEAPTIKTNVNQNRYEGLLGLASLAQGACMLAGWHADAMTIGNHFPPVAKELANIADDNETIAQPIDFLIKVGPYGALIAAAMPFVMQILANHGLIDATKAAGQGIVPPAVLEAQMKAEMMRMQAEAMQQQQEAINAANEAAASYAKLMNPEPVPA